MFKLIKCSSYTQTIGKILNLRSLGSSRKKMLPKIVKGYMILILGGNLCVFRGAVVSVDRNNLS